MRIAIDMQGAQSSGSWNRGIGRYTMSLALAIARNGGQHDIVLVLSAAFPESIERIRAKFERLLPQENIRVWHPYTPAAHIEPANEWRRHSSELIREAFIASLRPDFVIVTSLFEGLIDSAASSINNLPNQYLTAVILYDLIPFIHRQPYLENPAIEKWYLEKIKHLRNADLWLAISESSRQEGIKYLDLPSNRCINISTDADKQFEIRPVSTRKKAHLQNQYGLTKNFLLYTGGIDHRKNIERLISAFAKLSPQLRNSHQLAIVCSVQDETRKELQTIAKDIGLAVDQVILTGFVPEEDLIDLYNLCAVFVFPSWHEGFGLPALEAMRCGAPVIGSNTSSLPEVIGLNEALFDPYSDTSIATVIERVLTDDTFRAQLISHGAKHSKTFSWDETARRTISSIEQVVIEEKAICTPVSLQRRRPKLAYISPLPPERSGISDYSAELLPALAQHYEIDVVIAQDQVSDPWITENCQIRSVPWFIENRDHFDRVVYHIGNSSFHQHMFGLLEKIPGVVVMHDFFLSGVRHYTDALGYAPGCLAEHLYRSHGYIGLFHREQTKHTDDAIWKYPCSRDIFENSIGTIFHSDNSARLAKYWYQISPDTCLTIPLLRVQAKAAESSSARRALNLSDDDFIVCSFGMLATSKLNDRLVNAWLKSSLASSGSCHLIFVGECPSEEYERKIQSLIDHHPNRASIHITGWVDSSTFRKYLEAADLGVQLRTLSRGETSAAVLDCMNHGLATIINANGSMAELADDAVWMLPDEFDDHALTQALETLWHDPDKRHQIGNRAKNIILEKHNPKLCAEKYKTAIEWFYTKNPPQLRQLLKSIAAISAESVPDHELQSLSQRIAMTLQPALPRKTLFVDISGFVQHETYFEIRKVVRSILKQWLLDPPVGWRIEPVYATLSEPYRYARQFTTRFLGIKQVALKDDLLDFSPGDVFFSLDFCPQIHTKNAEVYQQLRQQGVVVKFFVHDIGCTLKPHPLPPSTIETPMNWLQIVGESDGAICTSKTDAIVLRNWISSNKWKRLRPFQVTSQSLGADVEKSSHSHGLPIDSDYILTSLRLRTSVLMIGTLEPHRCYEEALDAFELLWQSNTDINLVIVGEVGLMLERLADRIRSHRELGRRLFWLGDISDDYLEMIYQSSSCLFVASLRESFYLPLLEASRHKIPIIARNLPVFREFVGDHAFYFDGCTDQELCEVITSWLELYKASKNPKSDESQWLTWNTCSKQLLEAIGIKLS